MASLQIAVGGAIMFVLLGAVRSSRLRLTKANEDLKVKLDNFNNVQYSGPFSVGDIVMPVIYDTGSFEILVLSTMCTSCSQGHTFYDRRKSGTFLAAEGVTAEHLFGSGPVLSEKGFETVHIGRQTSPYGTQKTPFWQVIDHGIDVWNQNAHFSGIVGLGHPSHIPEGFSAEETADETLLSKMNIRTFAMCLQRSGAGAPGWLLLGDTIDALAGQSTAFQALEVVGQVHWGVRMTDVSIGSQHIPDPCYPSCGAIVDSGTSLIAVPPAAMSVTLALSRLVKRDCSNLMSLPTLKMKLDGREVELPPHAYVVQGFDGGCEAGFMAIDKDSQHGPVWILGMPFLRYYYTIFDRADRKIHIAESTPDCRMPAANVMLPAAPLADATRLVNASGMGGAGVAQRSRTFATADYQPTKVDMNATRVPGWAHEGYRRMDM